MALGSDPAGRVGVPIVPGVLDRPERRLDGVPSTLVLERVAHGLGDEGTATPTPDPAIELGDQLVIKAYV